MPFKTSFFAAVTAKPRLCKSVIKLAAEGSHTITSGVLPGVHFVEPKGTEEEMASLAKSYEHLCKMRDEIVELGIVPPVAEWTKMNPNL